MLEAAASDPVNLDRYVDDMKMLTKISAALVAVGAVAGAASAAEPVKVASLTSVSGRVLVYGGQNYALAKPGSALAVGNRVVALRGSKADVAFANGCVVRVNASSVLPIDDADN